MAHTVIIKRPIKCHNPTMSDLSQIFNLPESIVTRENEIYLFSFIMILFILVLMQS